MLRILFAGKKKKNKKLSAAWVKGKIKHSKRQKVLFGAGLRK